ncbi:MAG: hypothetical protein ACJ74H_10700 [Thermoanaerobaculia bacterium]
MRKGVRVIAAVTLLAAALSGQTVFAAQRTDLGASRAAAKANVFGRFVVWINSRLSPPIGVAPPPPVAPEGQTFDRNKGIN